MLCELCEKTFHLSHFATLLLYGLYDLPLLFIDGKMGDRMSGFDRFNTIFYQPV